MNLLFRKLFRGRAFWGINVAQFLGLLVLSYVFCSVYDPFFFDYDWFPLIFRQIHALLLGFLFLYLCSVIRVGGAIIYSVCLLFFSLCVYIYRTFRYSIGFDLIRAVFETNHEEASAFIGLYSVLTVAGYVALGVGVFWLFRRLTVRHRAILATCRPIRRWAFSFITMVLWYGCLHIPSQIIALRPTLHFRFADNTLKADAEMFIPGHSNVLIEHWIWQYNNFAALRFGLRERFAPVYFDDAAEYSSKEIEGVGPDVLVLIIGESIRANHLPVNGYNRNTLPKLIRRKNITFLNNMYSYGTSTYVSVEGIMTGLTQEKATPAFTSFLSILRKHGYHNIWVSENTYKITHSKRFHQLFGNCIDVSRELRMPMDEVSRSVLDLLNRDSKSKKCVIIENGTGHFPYRHDPEYSPFQPANIDWSDLNIVSKVNNELIINEYDNCIVCVDSMVDRLIEGLKDKKAVVLYCSDHGQKLGEQGRLMHGGGLNDLDLRHVASWIWLSDSYCERNKEIAENTPLLSEKILHQGQIYASILKLCGIESKVPLPVGDFWNDNITNHQNNLPVSIQNSFEKPGKSDENMR